MKHHLFSSLILPLGLAASLHTQAATIQAPVGSTLSAGGYHVCAIKEKDSTLECWGKDDHGQVTQKSSGAFLQVSAGYEFNCALSTDHRIQCWGRDGYGETSPPFETQPAGGKFIQVEAGWSHACALQEDGEVRCWGNSADGRVATLPGPFKQLALGSSHSCGLRLDGSVECWGYGEDGQTGKPSDTFLSISAGERTTCGINTDGIAKCWGWVSRELGYWKQVDFPLDIYTSNDGSYMVCGVKENLSLSCPSGSQAPTTGRFSYVTVGGHEIYKNDSPFACAIGENKIVTCWGDGNSGRTSPPQDLTVKAPFEIPGPTPGNPVIVGPDLTITIPYAIYQDPLGPQQEISAKLKARFPAEGGVYWEIESIGNPR